MRNAFLLRFQEPCQAVTASPSCGTQTRTRQHAEAADSDPGQAANRAIPVPGGGGVLWSTRTKTEVRTEGDDTDPRSLGHRAIPRCS